jgi:ketosteroid isomerase-like protein
VWLTAVSVCVLVWPGLTIGVGLETVPAVRSGPAAEEGSVAQPAAPPSDHDILVALNEDYIRSVQHADVARFEEILAEDFRASLGTVILDRQAFLTQTAQPVTISDLAAHDVEIRIIGDVAIVHASTSYVTADGEAHRGRYTDVWVRRDGRWLAVAAHVTR